MRVFYSMKLWPIDYVRINSQGSVNWLFNHTVNISPVQNDKRVVHGWLQKALGLDVDCFLGPKTIAATNGCREIPALINKIKHDAKSYYVDIAAAHPDQRQFLFGSLLIFEVTAVSANQCRRRESNSHILADTGF